MNWNWQLRDYHIRVQKIDFKKQEAQPQMQVHQRRESSKKCTRHCAPKARNHAQKCTRNIDSMCMQGPVLDIRILHYKGGSFGFLKERIAGRDDYGPL